MARALHSKTPYSSAQRMLGRVTLKNTRQPEAPRVSAASSSARPCSIITGINSRATKGKVTNIEAKIMPGKAKTMGQPCCTSQPPITELAPKHSTMHRPATTGDTENGRSIRVIRKALPRKSNLVMNQAAATPNTAFSGTASAATSSVSLIAEAASGLESEATAATAPLRNASAKTTISGAKRSTASRIRITPISNMRATGASVVTGRNAIGTSDIANSPSAPDLKQVDGE